MHLRDEHIEARKFLFVADFFDEGDFQALAIEITGKIEEEDFQMVAVFRRNHRIGAKVGDPLDGMALVPVQALREPPKWDGNVYTYHF